MEKNKIAPGILGSILLIIMIALGIYFSRGADHSDFQISRGDTAQEQKNDILSECMVELGIDKCHYLDLDTIRKDCNLKEGYSQTDIEECFKPVKLILNK